MPRAGASHTKADILLLYILNWMEGGRWGSYSEGLLGELLVLISMQIYYYCIVLDGEGWGFALQDRCIIIALD